MKLRAAADRNYKCKLSTLLTAGLALASVGMVRLGAADCTPPPAGLVGWWKGDGNALDSVGTSNGTLVNAGYTPGVVGQAFMFNGSGSKVKVSDQPTYALTDSLTIEGWIRPRGNGYCLMRGDNRSGLDPYGLTLGGGNLTEFFITQADGTAADLVGPALINNQWVHVTATLDGNTGAMRLYTNSVLAAQMTTSVRPFGALLANQEPGIGIGNAAGSLYNFSSFLDIDEIALYNRALTTNEIAAIYAAGSAGKCSMPLQVPPVITDFSPKAAIPGSIITLNGINFSPLATSNIVYFGAERGAVTFASPTNLQVILPSGATHAPPSVTVGGLTGTANNSFTPTFIGGGLLVASNFAPQVNLTSGTGPTKTVIADFDGDGKPDLAVTDGASHTVSAYRNISTSGTLTASSFASRVVLPAATGSATPYMMVAADVDGDGKLDLITSDSAANAVSVYRNLATPGTLTAGSFAPRVSFNVGTNPADLVVADVDNDGRPEILTANYNSANASVSILKNLSSPGSISFAPQVVFPTGLGVHGLAVADFDGDGRSDIATANDASPTVSLLRNISTQGAISSNSFATLVSLPGPNYSHFISTSDIDGDGKPDLILTTYLGQTVSVYRNLATPGTLTSGSFAKRVEFKLGARGHTVSIGDLNGDSKPDVIVDCEIPDRVCVFQNLSTPGSFTTNSFAPRVDLPAGYNAWGSSVGDLDGDAKPDITFANDYAANISVTRNLGPLLSPPVITNQPISQTVILGDPLAFNVGASGTAPFTYQWRFNGDNILGATNNPLVLPQAQLAQAGIYSVIVSNTAGSVTSSNATLTVTIPVCTSPPSGLVGWWQAEANTLDSVGTNNGTLSPAGVTFVPGKVGTAFHMDGTNGYVQIPDSPTLKPASVTVEAWVKLDALASPNSSYPGQQYIVFKKNTRSGNFEGYNLIKMRLSGRDCFTFGIASASGQQTLANSTTTPQVGVWYHLVGTYESSSGLAKVYVNGVLESNVFAGYPLNYGTRPVFIGTTGEGWDGKLLGAVDEVSIYNRALTSNEIAAIYAARGVGKCPLPPTLVSVTPTNWYVNEGATVSYTAIAAGSPALSYQWQHEYLDIPGATNPTLTLSNVVYAQAGKYTVVVSNLAGLASSNVTLRVNRAPIADAGATGKLIISPNNTNAIAVLDGSLSSDPDGDALTYAWFHAGDASPFATSVVAIDTLPVGTNNLTLTVNDGMASGSQTFAIEVITTSEALDRLIELVKSSAPNPQPLIASLRAALASIDRSQPDVAINQLEAFINKVHAQLEPEDPALAAQLIADAQTIIDALNGGSPVVPTTVEISSFSHGHGAKSHLKIKGSAGRVYIIETSTNMVDWVPTGVATQGKDGSLEFDDASSQDSGSRFYRILSPR